MLADVGIIGMAVMGQNLALNFLDKGYTVAVYNRSEEKTREIRSRSSSQRLIDTYSIEDFTSTLSKPRRIIVMVKAGKPVDLVINQLIPHLNEGDIVMDGGNSNFLDTQRRSKEMEDQGILYIGMGISGGEEGARLGPSIMPGGSIDAWESVSTLLKDISAKADGEPCCVWLGSDGAGHFVKTVHNGIEYGDMELIAEAYDLMRQVCGMSSLSIAEVFSSWDRGALQSYLIEITSQILSKIDEETGVPLVELIVDEAGQKGTGKWTVHHALELGLPVTLIGSAVFQRFLSAQKSQRKTFSELINLENEREYIPADEIIEDLENALYLAKIVSYSQGFELMGGASNANTWDLQLGEIAKIWRAGCIIRSQFLNEIADVYQSQTIPQLLLFAPYFLDRVKENLPALRRIVQLGTTRGIPLPGFSSALSYLDSLKSERLPANLIQAQRDYFGAHTYRRLDKDLAESYHSDWSS